jgi:hypothetical protein
MVSCFPSVSRHGILVRELSPGRSFLQAIRTILTILLSPLGGIDFCSPLRPVPDESSLVGGL